MTMKTLVKNLGCVLGSVGILCLSAGCNEQNARNTADTDRYSTNTINRDADNTGRNTQDRTNATLTPLDQGSSESDLRITQEIRQKVVAQTNNLSVLAQNVKIVTTQGKVTLRGPVNSIAEKDNIDALAKSVAGVASVDNQIEVKNNP
jgi:hyperosmotically inducible periplasmic protein